MAPRDAGKIERPRGIDGFQRRQRRAQLFQQGLRGIEIGVAKLIEVVTNRIPRTFGLDPVRDVQVLTPMLRGSLGSRNLNHELQRAEA